MNVIITKITTNVINARVDGDLYACGNNTFGQLMNGGFHEKITFHKVLSQKDIVSLSCGDNFTVFISSDFRIHRAGCNTHGELFIDTQKPCSLNPISSSVNRSYKLFGICCSNGYVILYRQHGNYFGEIYHHPKWKYYSFVVAPRRAKPLISQQQRQEKKSPQKPSQDQLIFIPSTTEATYKQYLMYRSIYDHFHLMRQEIIPYLKSREEENMTAHERVFSDISIVSFHAVPSSRN